VTPSRVRTSETDPIRVDFLPAGTGLAPGRLGMTFAPGKKAPGVAGNWERDLDADLERLVREFGALVLVSLLRPEEYALLGIEDLPDRAAAHQLDFHAFPITDAGVPSSVASTATLVQMLLARVRSGDTVVVHCRGGLGRAGLVAACCLTAVGYDADRAIATVRAARRSTIETRGQERFIAEFAEAGNHPSR
jgi:protein-tyrosine phosphatase